MYFRNRGKFKNDYRRLTEGCTSSFALCCPKKKWHLWADIP